VPHIEGAQHGITSDGFFELKKLPKKVAVIGGGYIGVELAGVLGFLPTAQMISSKPENAPLLVIKVLSSVTFSI
jgi:NADH dehydrogenase FAD-containing subunit